MMDDELKSALDGLREKIDKVAEMVLERRRRSVDALEDKLNKYMFVSGGERRKAVWLGIGLGAAVSLIINLAFHYLAR